MASVPPSLCSTRAPIRCRLASLTAYHRAQDEPLPGPDEACARIRAKRSSTWRAVKRSLQTCGQQERLATQGPSCDLNSDHTQMAPFSPDTVAVVTGSSRGLGLEFVKQLLENSQTRVVATARNPTGAKGLTALTEKFADRLKLIALDTSDDSGIEVCTATPHHTSDI